MRPWGKCSALMMGKARMSALTLAVLVVAVLTIAALALLLWPEPAAEGTGMAPASPLPAEEPSAEPPAEKGAGESP
jgi:cytochrome c-type biogenesis protein CcmH/NrfG